MHLAVSVRAAAPAGASPWRPGCSGVDELGALVRVDVGELQPGPVVHLDPHRVREEALDEHRLPRVPRGVVLRLPAIETRTGRRLPTTTPISSRHSRSSACSGVSPASTWPPTRSQQSGYHRRSGCRCASSARPALTSSPMAIVCLSVATRGGCRRRGLQHRAKGASHLGSLPASSPDGRDTSGGPGNLAMARSYRGHPGTSRP